MVREDIDLSSKNTESEHTSSFGDVWWQLKLASWIAFGTHLLAGLVMAVVLRQGLETNPDLAGRLAFLVERKNLWLGGWLVWNMAALSILFFYFALARAHMTDGKTPHIPLLLAVIFTIAAVPMDLAAEAIEMSILPMVAERSLLEISQGVSESTAVSRFLLLHRTAALLTGYLANGLYTLSAILLAWSTRHAYPRWVWGFGLGVGVSGVMLSFSALVNSSLGLVGANMALLPCLLLWQGGIARTVREKGGVG